MSSVYGTDHSCEAENAAVRSTNESILRGESAFIHMSKSEPFGLVTEHTRVFIWADAVFTLVMRRFERAEGWLCSLVM